MNPDEEAKKKLDSQYAQLKKYIEEYWNDEINKQMLVNGVWDTNTSTGNNPPQQTVGAQMYGYGISPTDVDAKGHYFYQEPERDEQGTFYGYKMLRWSNLNDCLQSPRYPARWINGELTANRVPNEYSMIGIHCTKRMDHPELNNYGNIYSGEYFLVRCALSGDVVIETEQISCPSCSNYGGINQWKLDELSKLLRTCLLPFP